jgi:hypothetical protein
VSKVQTSGLADNLSELTDIEQRQIPFATVLALTETAKLVKARLEDEMRSVFDRPTPYTMNGPPVVPEPVELACRCSCRKHRAQARIDQGADQRFGQDQGSIRLAD